MTQQHDIAIVLTAAIVVPAGSTAIVDASERRQQYLAAARFYAQYAPVFFLENSGYDILNDPDFCAIEGIKLRPIAAQENRERGKGYLEFHAIDLWHDSETETPRRILKITGRYIFANIEDLLDECRIAPESELLFDRHQHDRFAVTSIFSCSWPDYSRYLKGLYQQANDPAGVWIEHLVYDALAARNAPCRFFRHEPDVQGISGTSGQTMHASRLKYGLKRLLRSLNRLFDRRYLYLRGETLMPLKRLVS